MIYIRKQLKIQLYNIIIENYLKSSSHSWSLRHPAETNRKDAVSIAINERVKRYDLTQVTCKLNSKLRFICDFVK